MQPVMYSHRPKTVLQHTVRELDVTVALGDEKTGLSVPDTEAMTFETAVMLGIQRHFAQGPEGTYVTFFSKYDFVTPA